LSFRNGGSPAEASVVDDSGPDSEAGTGFQDAICALRLAVWTLERSVAHDGVDPLMVVALIARRAEELRRVLELERAVVA
jgi:hypothetical protein